MFKNKEKELTRQISNLEYEIEGHKRECSRLLEIVNDYKEKTEPIIKERDESRRLVRDQSIADEVYASVRIILKSCTEKEPDLNPLVKYQAEARQRQMQALAMNTYPQGLHGGLAGAALGRIL